MAKIKLLDLINESIISDNGLYIEGNDSYIKCNITGNKGSEIVITSEIPLDIGTGKAAIKSRKGIYSFTTETKEGVNNEYLINSESELNEEEINKYKSYLCNKVVYITQNKVLKTALIWNENEIHIDGSTNTFNENDEISIETPTGIYVIKNPKFKKDKLNNTIISNLNLDIDNDLFEKIEEITINNHLNSKL
ncbi:hypothetical protein [Photobacterium leiognathi]|uniref:hypothetical protein n=1 Tax=Photobacterium leiognathi TaxID=553611 RepID=UPI002981F1DA|nr:hypothetical protein [Photobacterium leiognathi]